MQCALVAILVPVLSPLPAAAQTMAFGTTPTTPDQPVEVTSDTLDVSQTDGTALFRGNVVVVQGEMRLSANQVVVTYARARSAIEKVVATGEVLLVSGPDAAESERAVYTPDSGQIVMTGNVMVTQGANAISSEKMTVNMATGTAQMSGRVRTILIPDSQ
ncbi:lipopolysaccharide transport periplasmic protein LptA [Chachezhania sediminis]|uniref:lipopolysaccharide transport periplasmic protein LptA n=1 Tax=Chachezhania sediminis TaxID=2599291 RepID=UPI00131BF329